MSRFDYSGFESTALGLITQFGQELTVYREEGGTFDPDTGANTGKTVASTICEGVAKASLTGPTNFDNDFKEALVKGSAKLFVVASKGMAFDPEEGDMVLYEGAIWDIHGTATVSPGGAPIVYHFGARKSGKSIPS